MHIDSAKKYVEIIFDYQFDLLYSRDCWGVNHAEFLFVQAARVIRNNAELKKWFIGLVEKNIFSSIVIGAEHKDRPSEFLATEFIFYFIHLSRWSEFNELAEKVKDTDSDLWSCNRVTTWSGSILEALADDWEDSDFYETFGGKNGI